MSVIHVSVIVMEQSRILENTLLRVDTPLDQEDAVIYRDDLDRWLKTLPIPGQSEPELPVDQATLLAIKLPQILSERDPNLFGPYYIDTEGDTSMVERRPYDWARLEAV